MKPSAVRDIAVAMMAEFGLTNEKWVFDFNSAKHNLGSCDYTSKTIFISRHVLPYLTVENVRHIMLHEISHARTPGNDHGSVWAAHAASIGYDESKIGHVSYYEIQAVNRYEKVKDMKGTPAGRIGIGDSILSPKTGAQAVIVMTDGEKFYAVDKKHVVYAVPKNIARANKVQRAA